MKTNGTIQLERKSRRARMSTELEDAVMHDAATLPLASSLAWFGKELCGVPRGAATLLCGDPGLGKTTLSLQVASAVATLDQTVLYIATEQSADALGRRLRQITPCPEARHNIVIKDDLYDLRVLPALLSHQLLRPGSALHNTKLVVIDSLQGCAGLCPSDRESWTAILDFMRRASGAGLSVIALAHRTKSGAIAGPRTLEHSCDVTLLMRRGVACRSIEVIKNRFGPSSNEPLPLRFNSNTTCLEPAPLGHGATASVLTLGGSGIVSIEAAVVPARSDRGYVKCPGMHGREVETLADTLERCWKQGRSMWAMGVTVRAPAGFHQERYHSLAIVAVMMAALGRAIFPSDTIFLGDVGLDGRILPASPDVWEELMTAADAGILESIRQVVAPVSQDDHATTPLGIRITNVGTIEEIDCMMEVVDEQK